MGFLNLFKRIIHNLEESRIPFIYYIITFFSTVILRDILETYTEIKTIGAIRIYHHLFWWFTIMMVIAIVLHYATKERIEKILKALMPGFIFILIGPIIDILIPIATDIEYLYVYSWGEFFLSFLTFFGPLKSFGISIGMRIEIALILIAGFCYLFIKTKKVFRSVLYTIALYFIIYCFLTIPFIKMALFGKPNPNIWSGAIVGSFMQVLCAFLLIILYFIYNRKYFLSLLKDIRIFRLLHFELLLVLGIIIGERSPVNFTRNPFSIEAAGIAIFFAWMFSVATNNMADVNIDRISNSSRPTIAKTIPIKHYKNLAIIFLLISLSISLLASAMVTFLIALFIGNYFLYSMPPFRLKRVPFASKMLLAFNFTVPVMIGYYLMTGSEVIPKLTLYILLALFSIGANIIDLKDNKGDAKAGIKTISTIFGDRTAKIIMAFLVLMLYIAFFFIFYGKWIMYALPPLGIAFFYFILKKNYNERYVMVTYLISFSLILLCL